MRRNFWLIAVAVGLLGFATATWADPIGPNCGSCFGTVITLQYAPVSSTTTTETVQVTLSIDTSGYSGAATDTLQQVAFKITNDAISATRVSAPTGWASGMIFIDSGLSALGCTGSGSGFICDDGSTNLDASNGTYTWVYNATIPLGTLLTAGGAASVKAHYVTADGMNAGITSENITLQQVPEASTTVLLGLSLLSLGLLGRKRLRVGR